MPASPELVAKRVAAMQAANRVQWIPKTCPGCAKEFSVKPSHAHRKFCSRACAGNALSFHRVKICVTCKKEFPVDWKTKKKITCSDECFYAEISRRQSAHNPAWDHSQKWRDTMHSPEYRKKLSTRFTGRIYTTDKNRRFSPQHAHAKEAFFRDPAGRIHFAQNITAFVKNHEHLFNPEDVVWKEKKRSLSCRASAGLISLQRTVETRLSWKGWTLVSRREGVEAVDYLSRQVESD